MTDRELLELAAKAAGKDIDLTRRDDDWGFAIRHTAKWWNPLADDGDALRLAVKLVLLVEVLPNSVTVAPMRGGIVNEEHGSDPYAATRRAIVRAAAELGKETK